MPINSAEVDDVSRDEDQVYETMDKAAGVPFYEDQIVDFPDGINPPTDELILSNGLVDYKKYIAKLWMGKW